MMTKQNFELIAVTIKTRADAIRASLPEGSEPRGAALSALANVVRDLAINLAVENPRFDRSRFMAACGFDEGFGRSVR